MKEPKAPVDKRQYHWLVAGEIVFNYINKDSKEVSVNSAKVNCIIFSEKSHINMAQLGRANQTLQMQFYQRMGGTTEGIEVTNLTILGMIPLGHMTNEEFNRMPEGMKLQQVPLKEVMPEPVGNT